MIKGNKKIVFFGIIILTIVIISGISFALWQITLKQENENSISTSCVKIVMKEENPIRIQSAYPISDEEGLSLIPFTFTIENVCETNTSFQVNLEVLNETELLNLEFLKVSFESIDEVRKPVFLTTKEEVNPTLKDEMKNPISKKAYKLESGYLGVGEKRNYNISLWLDENTPALEEVMNKSFLSKISVIATYIKDYDTESPITNVEVTNLTNQLKVDASKSSDNTNIKYYYYSLDGESFIKTRESEYTFEVGTLEYGVATEAIKTLADSLNEEYTVYVKTEDEYGNVSDVVSEKVIRDFAYDNTSDNNLRYIGANPNNYVLFNNELWRIIGVMENIKSTTDVYETKMKIIKVTPYKNMQMDSNIVGGWSGSAAQKELNSTYYNTLTEEAKKMISTTIWSTGSQAIDWDNFTPFACYQIERNNINNVGASSWRGNIAFMYASDYGYATSGGSLSNRQNCLNYTLTYKWVDEELMCYQNDWLHNMPGWTLTQHATGCFVRVGSTGSSVGNCGPNTDARIATPVVYLIPVVNFVDGIGSQTDPFILKMV